MLPFKRLVSRAPQGARGLKSHILHVDNGKDCRAPQGARGLKFRVDGVILDLAVVAPRKGRVG